MTDATRLGREAHQRIIAMIFDGALKSGDALQEAALGQQLGMSRTPVREAIKRMQSEGLAVPDGRMIRVHRLSPDEIEEIFFLRLQLEPFAARSAVRLPPARIDAMEARVRQIMARGPAVEDLHWQTDDAFHDMMAREAGNASITSLIAGLRRRTCVFDHTQVPDRFLAGCQEHLHILDAVRTGDPDRVQAGMRAHLENARDAVLHRLDELPDDTGLT